jgi:WD40 repeat protein
VAISPDGRRVASGCRPAVKTWDVKTGQVRDVIRMNIGVAGTVAFSPDGGKVASAGDGYLAVWHQGTGKVRKLIEFGWDTFVHSFAFSPDGRWVATGSGHDTVKFWDAQTGVLNHTLVGHHAEVSSVAFSSDSHRLASASQDGTIRLWDPSSGKLLVTLMILPATLERTTGADWIAFTPEGYYDGSPGASRFIRWRAGNRLCPAEEYAHTFHRPDQVRQALAQPHQSATRALLRSP